VFKDTLLQVQSVEFGSIKYVGQVRNMKKQSNTQQTVQGDSEGIEYTKCGYGKLTWPDGSNFEGFWLNGQAVSIGIFRNADNKVFEGTW
jgi:hypothetical protein